jgi:serine/threonine protein kinase
MNEISIQRMLSQCPGTTKIFKVYENAIDIGILMEFHEGENLADVIKKKGESIHEAHIKLIVAQVLLSVDFLSKKEVTHRDLKPENVLFNNPASSGN